MKSQSPLPFYSNFFHYLEFEEYLSNLLEIKVDLVMKKALKPDIGRNILKEVIYV